MTYRSKICQVLQSKEISKQIANCKILREQNDSIFNSICSCALFWWYCMLAQHVGFDANSTITLLLSSILLVLLLNLPLSIVNSVRLNLLFVLCNSCLVHEWQSLLWMVTG